MRPVAANRTAAITATGSNLTDTDPAQVEQDEILAGQGEAGVAHDVDPADSVAHDASADVAVHDDPAVSGENNGDAPPAAGDAGTVRADDRSSRDNDSAAEAELTTAADAKAGGHSDAVAGDESNAAASDESDAEDDDYDAAYEAHLAEPEAEPHRAVFADLGLSEPVLRAIEEMGYRHPTPIQEQAIPVVLMTRDVLGVAQTGTGKTAGFTLPMLDILAGSRARARMPRSLILEPTRELALQVAENFVQYGKYLKLTHALIIGGESMSDQKDVLNRGVDVLIATPGRLIDMFERGSILLTDTRILVIDEADRMLDMGFIPDVERIVSLLPKTRQTLFFSATMGPEIRRLADAFLQNPKEITVSRSATVAVGIIEGLALVAEHDKREALRRLIRTQNVQNALIFCNRKREVDILHKSLVRHKFDAGALHGDMAQTVRFTTLEKFKAGELRLLVCSDVAARGLDIGGLSHVFNFDVPHHAEDYVHRIGRTGRAGLEGHAFTIAMPEDWLAVEAIEKLTGHPIPPMIVEGLDPVDWAETDGRKRRGRKAPAARKASASKSAPVAKSPRAKSGEERTPRVRDPSSPARKREERAPRDRPEETVPRVARTHDEAAPAHEPIEAMEAAAQPELPPRSRDAAPRMRSPREEPRTDEPRTDESRRDEPRRDEPRRDEPRRDAQPHRDRSPREERRPEDRQRWRQDDLGPAVVGFGSEIPAFMMVRRRPTPAPVPESDA
jgi:superfamily II DNA/RNA helicase